MRPRSDVTKCVRRHLICVWVAGLWRYPVKSMAGEPLRSAWLAEDGIPGDRLLHVEDPRGRVVSSRSRPKLLLHRGSLDGEDQPLVDGRAWTAANVAADVIAAAGPGSRLVHDDSLDRFDVLPLLVATDGAIAAFGYDSRRLRPNLIIGGVAGLAERQWEGRHLVIGKADIEVVSLRARCIMTTFDPDTGAQDVEVLKKIHRDFDGKLALDCRVKTGGLVAVGDAVRLE
jgi:uncharacterized protein YcbX